MRLKYKILLLAVVPLLLALAQRGAVSLSIHDDGRGFDAESVRQSPSRGIGSNGAGKTTTMRAVSGMIAPTGGSITLNGKRIDGLEPFDVASWAWRIRPEAGVSSRR